jgi:hypothetical protein
MGSVSVLSGIGASEDTCFGLPTFFAVGTAFGRDFAGADTASFTILAAFAFFAGFTATSSKSSTSSVSFPSPSSLGTTTLSANTFLLFAFVVFGSLTRRDTAFVFAALFATTAPFARPALRFGGALFSGCESGVGIISISDCSFSEVSRSVDSIVAFAGAIM